MLVAMRWVFALLLMSNIALFVTMQLPRSTPGIESMAAHTPFQAERIRLVGDEEVERLPAAPPAPVQICMEWTVTSQDLERAQTALKPLQLNESDVTVRQELVKPGGYWVYIPPQKTKQDAYKKVEELKGLGVQESFVIQDGNKWRYAISLGVFSNEEGATKHLGKMHEKGVKSAKSGPRNHESEHSSLTIRAVREDLEVELVKAKQAFPGSELKAVACEP